MNHIYLEKLSDLFNLFIGILISFCEIVLGIIATVFIVVPTVYVFALLIEYPWLLLVVVGLWVATATPLLPATFFLLRKK